MNPTLERYLRYTSWPIILAMLGLIAYGIAAIHVAQDTDFAAGGHADTQLVWAVVAVGMFVVMTIIPYSRLGRWAFPLFALTLVGLVSVLVLPESIAPSVKGARRWIDLRVLRVQPSELTKIAYILMLAWYLRYRSNYRRISGLVLPFVLTFVPMGLILVEPDLGTSLLFLPTLYIMLFMAGAKLKHLLGIVAVATALILLPVPHKVDDPSVEDRLAYWSNGGQDRPATWAIRPLPLTIQVGSRRLVADHQISRIEGWLGQGDERLAMSKGYQLRLSKMVLGAGKWTGQGDWSEAGLYFDRLPETHTDFIFSVLAGQWGFLGAAVLLGLYGIIFLFGSEIAVITDDPFGRLLAVGVLALLFSQIVINVGMTMGLMPITGMTLPLVSYGGSSLVVNCMALGLLVNVGIRRPVLLAPKPFEHARTG
jgi:rod shape-determining protein RodA